MIFISDLHIGNKGKADDFKGNENNLITFLKTLPDRSIIFVGDILELLQFTLEEVEAEYPELLELLFRKARVYVVGNHDKAMLVFREYREVPVVEKLIVKNTLIMHLHQFDWVNSKGHVLGDFVAKIGGWLEKYVWKDIDIWFSKFERWARQNGRFGSSKAYREASFEFIQNFVYNGTQITQIVGGHSHKLDKAELNGFKYFNCGTWTNGKQDSIEINV